MRMWKARTAWLAFLALAPVPTRAEAQGYRTENVVIAVMDGTPWKTTFGDPERRHIPRLWGVLRPQGTLYARFYNDDVTITKAGHSVMTTGTWQKVRNRGPRQTMPSLFDYLADEKGLTPDKAWVVFGKGLYAYDPTTSFPTYRGGFAPSSLLGIGESSLADDSAVYAKVLEVMKTDRPRVIFANFGGTDHLAHSGNWDRHVAALRHQDNLLVDLWSAIQADPHYRDRTAFFLTNDHGYHLDGHREGFAEHGDDCEGCRHIVLLAVGPDIKNGVVVEEPAFLTDLAPTVGELLGVQTPLAHGRVLASCLSRPLGLNRKEARTEKARAAQRLEAFAAGNVVKSLADRVLERGAARLSALPSNADTALLLWGLLSAYDKTGDVRYRDAVRAWVDARKATAAAEDWPAALVMAELAYRVEEAGERARLLDTARRVAAAGADALDPARAWPEASEPALRAILLASVGEAARDRALWEKARSFLVGSYRAADFKAATDVALGPPREGREAAPGPDVVRVEGKVLPTGEAHMAAPDRAWMLLALAKVRSHGLPYKGEYFEDVPELRAEAAVQSALAVKELPHPGEVWPLPLQSALNVAAIQELRRRKDAFEFMEDLSAIEIVHLRPDAPEVLPRLDEVRRELGKISARNYNVKFYGFPPYEDFDYTVDLLRLHVPEAPSDLELGAFLLALEPRRLIPFEPHFRGPR